MPIKQKTNLRLTLNDRIFLGEGLFETLRVQHALPEHSFLHWHRLKTAALLLGIAFELSFEEWQTRLMQQIQKDQLYEGGLKVILSGGAASRGLAERGYGGQLLMESFHYTPQTKPNRLISAPWLRDAANPVYRVKSVNYLEAILARRHALSRDVDDVLFFNHQHHATETTCANFFLIREEGLYTPPLTDGVLPGITRSRLLALALDHQIPCFEQSITESMIETADALFTTNSLQGIQWVSLFNGIQFKMDHSLMSRLIYLLQAE